MLKVVIALCIRTLFCEQCRAFHYFGHGIIRWYIYILVWMFEPFVHEWLQIWSCSLIFWASKGHKWINKPWKVYHHPFQNHFSLIWFVLCQCLLNQKCTQKKLKKLLYICKYIRFSIKIYRIQEGKPNASKILLCITIYKCK